MSRPLLNSTVEAIGETPLVELSRLVQNRGLSGRILAKLDHLNPGFSKKDRVARQIIEDAEADGVLRPGQTVVEMTSGNTGTGLAIVCGVKAYPFVAVMSRGNTPERARMMRALGAEVVLVDQLPGSADGVVTGEDLKLVDAEAGRIVEERSGFRADQFESEGNRRAHYLRTGPEILRQCGGQLDAFCDFVGSGGSFGGCARAFKEANEQIRCFVIEPEGAAVIAGEALAKPDHPIQGGGYAIAELTMIDRALIDGFVRVGGQTAIQTARALAKEEGIFAGFSSGANVAAAIRLLEGEMEGKTVAVLICDSGLKYLSTDLWSG
ncbi:MAG: cysteine synthase [Verrucomicrobiales bacterium]|nr:cysteine synthase [Verrucomicrobiales bacterium]